MFQSRYLVLFVLMFMMSLTVVAHGSVVQSGHVLYAEDFSKSDIGDLPTGWTVTSGHAQDVTVVQDDQLGQAVHIQSGGEAHRTRVTSPTWKLPTGDVSKIGIEYNIRMVPGSFTGNVYLLRRDTASFVSIHHPGGTRVVSRGKTTGNLIDGEWNHIRVLVDLKNNVYELYVNDMENRIRMDDDKNENYRNGLFDFRMPIESWAAGDNFHIYIDQEGRADTISEATYTDFNVWVIE